MCQGVYANVFTVYSVVLHEHDTCVALLMSWTSHVQCTASWTSHVQRTAWTSPYIYRLQYFAVYAQVCACVFFWPTTKSLFIYFIMD